MLKKIDEEAKRIDKVILEERKNRGERLATVKKDIVYELEEGEKLIKNFYEKTRSEFLHQTDGLEKEMDNRFEHQDKTVDELSHLVNTFQATLKVVGKDV
jgi:hypothetical protein